MALAALSEKAEMNLKLNSEVLYTITEVATLLKVNKNMVYNLINKGYLKSIKLGCHKVTRKALMNFLEKYESENFDTML